jgi:hypothetical protein
MKKESKTLVERYLYRTLDSVDQHLCTNHLGAPSVSVQERIVSLQTLTKWRGNCYYSTRVLV